MLGLCQTPTHLRLGATHGIVAWRSLHTARGNILFALRFTVPSRSLIAIWRHHCNHLLRCIESLRFLFVACGNIGVAFAILSIVAIAFEYCKNIAVVLATLAIFAVALTVCRMIAIILVTCEIFAIAFATRSSIAVAFHKFCDHRDRLGDSWDHCSHFFNLRDHRDHPQASRYHRSCFATFAIIAIAFGRVESRSRFL